MNIETVWIILGAIFISLLVSRMFVSMAYAGNPYHFFKDLDEHWAATLAGAGVLLSILIPYLLAAFL